MTKLRPTPLDTQVDLPAQAPSSHWNDLGELQRNYRRSLDLLRAANKALRHLSGYRDSRLEHDVLTALAKAEVESG